MAERAGAGKKVSRWEREPAEISRSRLEFLFDGVFAIAMTLLVLELKVPDLQDPRSVRELLAALGHHGAGFFSYLLSFAMLGVLWYKHQRQYRYIRRITRGAFVANIALMATAASFPFCAAVFARYPTNGLSVVLYLACLFAHMVASYMQWSFSERAGALDPELAPACVARFRQGNLRGALTLGLLTVVYLGIAITRL